MTDRQIRNHKPTIEREQLDVDEIESAYSKARESVPRRPPEVVLTCSCSTIDDPRIYRGYDVAQVVELWGYHLLDQAYDVGLARGRKSTTTTIDVKVDPDSLDTVKATTTALAAHLKTTADEVHTYWLDMLVDVENQAKLTRNRVTNTDDPVDNIAAAYGIPRRLIDGDIVSAGPIKINEIREAEGLGPLDPDIVLPGDDDPVGDALKQAAAKFGPELQAKEAQAAAAGDAARMAPVGPEYTAEQLAGSASINLLSSGLLWLINRCLFHRIGRALALSDVGDFRLLGDGTETWVFGDGMADNAEAAARRLLGDLGVDLALAQAGPEVERAVDGLEVALDEEEAAQARDDLLAILDRLATEGRLDCVVAGETTNDEKPAKPCPSIISDPAGMCAGCAARMMRHLADVAPSPTGTVDGFKHKAHYVRKYPQDGDLIDELRREADYRRDGRHDDADFSRLETAELLDRARLALTAEPWCRHCDEGTPHTIPCPHSAPVEIRPTVVLGIADEVDPDLPIYPTLDALVAEIRRQARDHFIGISTNPDRLSAALDQAADIVEAALPAVEAVTVKAGEMPVTVDDLAESERLYPGGTSGIAGRVWDQWAKTQADKLDQAGEPTRVRFRLDDPTPLVDFKGYARVGDKWVEAEPAPDDKLDDGPEITFNRTRSPEIAVSLAALRAYVEWWSLSQPGLLALMVGR